MGNNGKYATGGVVEASLVANLHYNTGYIISKEQMISFMKNADKLAKLDATTLESGECVIDTNKMQKAFDNINKRFKESM